MTDETGPLIDVEIAPDMTPVNVETIIEGILDPLEVADEVEQLYLNGAEPGLHPGLLQLGNHYRPKKGLWTAITGVPGSGKSTLVDTIMVNLSELHGWKHLICSPENQPVSRHIATLAGVHARQTFHRDYLSEQAYISALQWVQDHFKFVNPPEESFTVPYILGLGVAVEAQGFAFDGFTIDPWNEMEHKRPAGFSETEYTSWALSKFRRYVLEHKKHLWVVAHPTKLRKIENKNATLEESSKPVFPVATLYDISGSAHWFNKTDYGLSVWRDKYAHDNQSSIHVQKIRFKECGQLGTVVCRFDWQTGRIEDL
jgi:twinkle protein